MISISNVCKYYNKKIALNGVSLSIPEKSIVVVAGVNGAGKTTLLKCLAGLISFSGEIMVDGKPLKSLDSKRKIAFCTEVPEIFDFLTLEEHIHYWALALGIDNWSERADKLYRRFKLENYIHVLGKDMSKGIKQKTALCCAFIREEGYFILDEPMVGLDPYAIKELKKIIAEKKAKGCSFVISTHILESVEDIWDFMFVIDNGIVVKSIQNLDSESIIDSFFDTQKR